VRSEPRTLKNGCQTDKFDHDDFESEAWKMPLRFAKLTVVEG